MENESSQQSLQRTLQPGRKVRFKLKNVHLPAMQEVLNRMTPETELQGAITLLSSDGTQADSFAIVEVKGIASPVIVPTSRVQVAADESLIPVKSW